MYDWMLSLHSILRWAVVLLGLAAAGRGLAGWVGSSPWTSRDDAVGRWFTIVIDLQLIIGLALYGFFSPATRAAMADMGAAMSDPELRYWAVEHLTGMVLALVAVHVVRARTKRMDDATRRHRWAALGFGLAILLIAISIPWPFLANARPWLRLP